LSSGATTTLKAIACKSGYLNSSATSSTYDSVQTYDYFAGTSGTLLSSHTDNGGNSWVQWSSGPDSTNTAVLNGSGAVSGNVSNQPSSYYNNLTPSSANYTVTGTCTSESSGSTSTICAIYGRLTTGSENGYMWQNQTGTCKLFAIAGGAFNQIGSNVSCAWGVGVGHAMGLSMNGTTITGLIDGVATAATGTDSSATAAGKAGLRMGNSSGGTPLLSQFSVQ
jgi:hypothetical protein